MSLTIRPMTASDNPAVAQIIRSVMPEFGAGGAGFAIHDPEVSAMFEAYARPRAQYFVVELNGEVCGGAGIAQLTDAAPELCELRKMYFLPVLRGRGAGQALMQECLKFARSAGFTQVYLETLTGMDAAQRLYTRSGFAPIANALGATGHFGCNRFYLLELAPEA